MKNTFNVATIALIAFAGSAANAATVNFDYASTVSAGSTDTTFTAGEAINVAFAIDTANGDTQVEVTDADLNSVVQDYTASIETLFGSTAISFENDNGDPLFNISLASLTNSIDPSDTLSDALNKADDNALVTSFLFTNDNAATGSFVGELNLEQQNAAVVPLPASALLLLGGLAGLGALARRRKPKV